MIDKEKQGGQKLFVVRLLRGMPGWAISSSVVWETCSERGTRADLGPNRGMGIDLGVNDRSEVEDPSAEIYARFFACQASKERVSF